MEQEKKILFVLTPFLSLLCYVFLEASPKWHIGSLPASCGSKQGPEDTMLLGPSGARDDPSGGTGDPRTVPGNVWETVLLEVEPALGI